MKSTVIIGIAVLTVVIAGTANAAYLTTTAGEITGAAADSEWGHLPAIAAADESGLTGDLHDQGVGYWTPKTSGTSHWWSVEFDQAYPLGDAWIWNSRHSPGGTYGFKSTDVYYTPAGGGAEVLLGNFEFAIATGEEPIAHQTEIPFGGVMAEGVRFQQLTDWGAAWGSGGLEEARFNLVPEPTALTLLGLGGLMMMLKRRRSA